MEFIVFYLNDFILKYIFFDYRTWAKLEKITLFKKIYELYLNILGISATEKNKFQISQRTYSRNE